VRAGERMVARDLTRGREERREEPSGRSGSWASAVADLEMVSARHMIAVAAGR
jgi:hypothetical protein